MQQLPYYDDNEKRWHNSQWADQWVHVTDSSEGTLVNTYGGRDVPGFRGPYYDAGDGFRGGGGKKNVLVKVPFPLPVFPTRANRHPDSSIAFRYCANCEEETAGSEEPGSDFRLCLQCNRVLLLNLSTSDKRVNSPARSAL